MALLERNYGLIREDGLCWEWQLTEEPMMVTMVTVVLNIVCQDRDMLICSDIFCFLHDSLFYVSL